MRDRCTTQSAPFCARSCKRALLFIFVILFCRIRGVAGNDETHVYKRDDPIVLWAVDVAPSGDLEPYFYSFFPLCGHNHLNKTATPPYESAVDAGIPVRALRNVSESDEASKCTVTLPSNKSIELLQKAVRKGYRVSYVIDGNLPLWGPLGFSTVHSDHPNANNIQRGPNDPSEWPADFVFKNRHLRLGYTLKNGNPDEIQIVTADIFPDGAVPFYPGIQSLEYTYTYDFVPSDVKFHDRIAHVLHPPGSRKIHWAAALNSFLLAATMCTLILVVLYRSLRRDFVRYSRGSVLGFDGDFDDWGWKFVSNDVFRSPVHRAAFAALFGSGVQIASLVTFSMLVMLMVKDLLWKSASRVLLTVICYVASSALNGFVACRWYTMYGGKRWYAQAAFCSLVVPAALFAVFLVLETVAGVYSTLSVMPGYLFLILVATYIFAVIPLTVLGARRGRLAASDFPCRVNAVPRVIPVARWYQTALPVTLLGGLIPFISVVVELQFVIAGYFGTLTTYEFGFGLYFIFELLVTAACCSVFATYTILSAENHLWHWIPFRVSAATVMYVLLYTGFLYLFVLPFSGAHQATFFFGTVATACLLLFLSLGAVGYLASHLFVNKIYANLKTD